MEIRIPYWPGIASTICIAERRLCAIFLLCGGDKRTQRQDIKRAQMLAETL